MRIKTAIYWLGVAMLSCALCVQMQAQSSVPGLVNYSGRVADAHGKAICSPAGVTFAIYKDQYSSSPLWIETQNVHPDARETTGPLGAATSQGLPLICSLRAKHAGWECASMVAKSSRASCCSACPTL